MSTLPPHLRLPAFALLALLCAAPACRAEAVIPAHHDAPFEPAKAKTLRIVLIGDTSEPVGDMAKLRKAILAEQKDLVVVAGDLVHPRAPECPDGHVKGAALAELDRHVGAAFNGLGAPVLLAFGNHDIPWDQPMSAAAACIIDYAAKHDDLVLPAATYLVDYGVALLAVTNTLNLTDADGKAIAAAFKGHQGWKLAFGHHTLKTYRDKEGQDDVRPWLAKHGIKPDLWGNGHAHLLQLGVYDGVVAVTSGTAARTRKRATCPPECGAGELFGNSDVGYALIELTEDTLAVTMKDADRKVLHTWRTRRAVPGPAAPGAPARPAPAKAAP